MSWVSSGRRTPWPQPSSSTRSALRSGRANRAAPCTTCTPSISSRTVSVPVVDRTGIDLAEIDDVITGVVTQSGEQSLNIARRGLLAAGYPESVPGVSVDRQCGSGQQAIAFAAQAVASAPDVVVAAGVESMSRVPMGLAAFGTRTSTVGVRGALPRRSRRSGDLRGADRGAVRHLPDGDRRVRVAVARVGRDGRRRTACSTVNSPDCRAPPRTRGSAREHARSARRSAPGLLRRVARAEVPRDRLAHHGCRCESDQRRLGRTAGDERGSGGPAGSAAAGSRAHGGRRG